MQHFFLDNVCDIHILRLFGVWSLQRREGGPTHDRVAYIAPLALLRFDAVISVEIDRDSAHFHIYSRLQVIFQIFKGEYPGRRTCARLKDTWCGGVKRHDGAFREK